MVAGVERIFGELAGARVALRNLVKSALLGEPLAHFPPELLLPLPLGTAYPTQHPRSLTPHFTSSQTLLDASGQIREHLGPLESSLFGGTRTKPLLELLDGVEASIRKKDVANAGKSLNFFWRLVRPYDSVLHRVAELQSISSLRARATE
jgi:hypothetical protein